MAVYTHLGAEELAELIAHYDVGALISAKGIAEGVSNSNWLIETSGGNTPDQSCTGTNAGPNTGTGAQTSQRFILTMYERRIDVSELPFFLGLLDHLAAKGCPVPRTIHDKTGAASRMEGGKAVALIEFLPGVSVDHPTPAQGEAVGRALASIHLASADFTGRRDNDLRPRDWAKLIEECGADGLSQISDALPELVAAHLEALEQNWPETLPLSIIHADLFPDNVLMLDNTVSGLIDFYFACYDLTAYDLAVTHAAWSFGPDGRSFNPAVAQALMRGYEAVRRLSDAERAALPLLAKGASMRIIATRAYDWLHTPQDALVTRKDPMDFARRLIAYDAMGDSAFVTGL